MGNSQAHPGSKPLINTEEVKNRLPSFVVVFVFGNFDLVSLMSSLTFLPHAADEDFEALQKLFDTLSTSTKKGEGVEKRKLSFSFFFFCSLSFSLGSIAPHMSERECPTLTRSNLLLPFLLAPPLLSVSPFLLYFSPSA